MILLIKSAKVVSASSPFNNKVVDILIDNGIIISIAAEIESCKDYEVFTADNLHISEGWMDMRCNLNDPGFEHKEDLISGSAAAAAGGFTAVVCTPSTQPPINTKSQVEYIKNKSQNLAVDVYPMGCLSNNMEGKDISEMYDMHLSGAVAFTDNKRSIVNAGLLNRAILYANGFGGLVINYPDDASISLDGKMNEGIVSTSLGLKGIPALAEELIVSRDIFLTEYTGGKIHLASISSATSVQRIRGAKVKKYRVTADIAAHQLLLDESSLTEFDSNYKVKPPLRTKSDIAALIEGIKDGTIDVVCSDHTPQDVESKIKEFDLASFGIIGLETTFAATNTALSKEITLQKIIDLFTINPRKIIGISSPIIKEGEPANITLFNPTLKWTFNQSDIRSKSANTPFVGYEFIGKALAIVNKGKFIKN
jgi:dihydroorotase